MTHTTSTPTSPQTAPSTIDQILALHPHLSFTQIGKKLGLTRNQVAGLKWKHCNPDRHKQYGRQWHIANRQTHKRYMGDWDTFLFERRKPR